MATEKKRQRKALVVGAGPVGALTALCLHCRGWDVEIWESRQDPRGQDTAITNLRSINLAISARGLEALRSVDPTLAEHFLSEAIPMKGRMIHHTDGRQESQIYDPITGQCINSISRPILNQRLVEALPAEIKARFDIKLSRVDFQSRRAYGLSRRAKHGQAQSASVPGQEELQTQGAGGDLEKTGHGSKGKAKSSWVEDEEGTAFDLVVGCDGSWSKVRSEMMRVERIDFSQSFIPHAYIELHMPADPSKPDKYAMDRNHLHIWPRHNFMLIGLPNKDGSFTLTLFAPFASLATIQSRDEAKRFFNDNFPTAVAIAGEERLLDDFEKNPRGNLVTINAYPASWASHAVLLGDASHSMVPFYGQGLNCGLEDVRVLNAYLERHQISATTSTPLGGTDLQLESALAAYSTDRKADLEAICELALNNYTEMRSTVLSPLHHLRRHLDSFLATILPRPTAQSVSLTNPFPTRRVRGWTSLYEMVTFRPDVGYAEALRRERWQKEVLGWGVWIGGAGAVGLAGMGGWLALKAFKRSI